MSLTKKTVTAIAFIIPVSTLIVVFVLWIYVSSQFDVIERKEVRRDLDRFTGLVEREITSVDSFCKDFAYWDDTYDFMKSPRQSFIKDNFNSPYLKSQNIQFVCIHDLKGRVLHCSICDKDTRELISSKVSGRNNSLINDLVSESLKREGGELGGLWPTPYGLLMVFGRSVTDDSMKAESRGRIIAGRYLCRREIERLCSLMEVDVAVRLPGDNNEEVQNKIRKINSSGENILLEEDENNIHAYRVMYGIEKKPAAVFDLKYPRDIMKSGLETVKFSAVFTLIYGLILMQVVLVFLRKSILNPLNSLTSMTSKIREDGILSLRLPEHGNNEISTLAGSFNSLLRKLTSLNGDLETSVDKRTSELSRANRELLLMEKVFYNSLEGIIITDDEAVIINVNPAFSKITGYEKNEVVGDNPRILKSDKHQKEYYDNMWGSLKSEGYWANEIWNRHKDGKAYPEWISISAIKDLEGETTNYVGLFHDMSDIKRQEEFIRYQAFHDALTDLPNRLLFQNRLHKAISHSKRSGSVLAVIFLDLDNFKNINDSLGHPTGDLILKDVAARLTLVARAEDTVARHGGDEFIIMIENTINEKPAVSLSKRIIKAFREPFNINGRDFFMGTSMGIALYPADGEDGDTLISNADAAMYRAKKQGRHTFVMYTPSINETVCRRLRIENDLRTAIKESLFEVHYQPKVNLATGKIIGMEGLVRWRHNDQLISPDDFIPLAEESGLISEIDSLVMSKAFAEVGGMMNSDQEPLKLALNCSAKSLLNTGLVQMVKDNLVEYGVKPECFEIEITETSIMENVSQSREVLMELMEMGISISLDDFGTGYSSLAQLKVLPIHSLKIDRSFISQLDENKNDADITESIIAMSGKLGIEVVGEGVEKIEQYDFLKKAGCDMVQGYYISRPISFETFKKFVAGSR